MLRACMGMLIALNRSGGGLPITGARTVHRTPSSQHIPLQRVGAFSDIAWRPPLHSPLPRGNEGLERHTKSESALAQRSHVLKKLPGTA